MSTEYYLSEAPPGTSKAKIQKLVQTHQGDKVKILADINKMNAEYQEKNSWVEVRQKPKKKVTKPVTNYKAKKQYNGHENGQRKPYSKNFQGQKPQKNNLVASSSSETQDVKPSQSVPQNTWASKLFTEKQEEAAKEETVEVSAPVEVKPPSPKPEKQLTVTEVEADLKKATVEAKEKVKEDVKEEVTINPKVILSAETKKNIVSSEVPGVGKVSFGSNSGPVTVSLESLIAAEGKEVVEKGTMVKMAALEIELKRAKDEINTLKEKQAEVQSEKNKASTQSLEYSRRVQELENAAKEKDILRDEVAQLTQQLKEHKISQSQLYDRLKEDKKTKQEEKTKPSGPPPGHVQQQGFNVQPQHQVFPTGMPYYQPPPPYFSQYPQYPPPHPNRSHYSYDNQPGGHGPPSHPPGTNAPPGAGGSEHNHFHDEFRGSSMRRMQSSQNAREHPLDKNVQNAAPPGYGNPTQQQQQQYNFPPNQMYPQPPYHGQGQQKWPGR